MKKIFSIFIAFCMVATLLTGCTKSEDYSKYPFVNIKWTRATENDTEYIRFGDDGSFSYYCACGNPVNDFDLCDGYSYDESSKTITLKFSEKTENAVAKIKVKKCTKTD